jgi:hypothetical protein
MPLNSGFHPCFGGCGCGGFAVLCFHAGSPVLVTETLFRSEWRGKGQVATADE